MPAFVPQSKEWPADRALLLVHGVGSYQPGDYDRLRQALQAALGAAYDQHAVYEMFWDPISDWFVEKQQAAGLFASLIGRLKLSFDASQAGNVLAEGAGDVIWPVLLLAAREALRDACVQQIQQLVKDGRARGIARPDMRLSVICHSLGCFHTFEALSAAASDADLALDTETTGLQFESALMIASPVQMIRSVASGMGGLVPLPGRLYCLRGGQLQAPGFVRPNGQFLPYARRILELTGDLDPVGGYLWRSRLDWAYMNLPGADRYVESQHLAGLDTEADLVTMIQDALAAGQPWTIQPGNPHDWVGYVTRNAERIREWMLA